MNSKLIKCAKFVCVLKVRKLDLLEQKGALAAGAELPLGTHIYLLSTDPGKLKDYYLSKVLNSFTGELDFFCFCFKKAKLI